MNHERSPRGHAQLLEGDDQMVTLDVAGRELRLARDEPRTVDYGGERYRFTYATSQMEGSGELIFADYATVFVELLDHPASEEAKGSSDTHSCTWGGAPLRRDLPQAGLSWAFGPIHRKKWPNRAFSHSPR